MFAYLQILFQLFSRQAEKDFLLSAFFLWSLLFNDTHKPARSCVAVKELPKGVPVEIEAIALAGRG